MGRAPERGCPLTATAARERLVSAHAEFVQHDAHCRVCSVSSRFGTRWQQRLCDVGADLWRKVVAVEASASREGAAAWAARRGGAA